jgi:hypothetical protein
VNRRTVDSYYRDIREQVFAQTLKESRHELDESYFGAKRIRGKHGRGAAGKTPALNPWGLSLKDDWQSLTVVIPNILYYT